MDENQNPTFSDVPELDDVQGLNEFLDKEALKAQGVAPAPEAAAPQTQEDNPAPTAGISSSQLADIKAQIEAINARLAAPQQQVANNNQAAQQIQYTPQEINFVNAALARGYDMSAINRTIIQKRMEYGNGQANQLASRINNLENYLRAQEYKQAENVFIDRLSTFGDKWGLSEQDLVTFGTVALQKGINIATPNVDLETVFRAVYPEQYAIRSQRMTSTNTSQIYGGTSVQEGNRVQASRLEDAYVDSFLKNAMPNYGKK